MKKLKYFNLIITLSCVFALFLTSCKDDDDSQSKLVVSIEEAGHDNSHTAHPGHDLHLEASILAEASVKRIDIEIHGHEGNNIVNQSYTDGKYIGVKNAEFHEHIDIPADAALGEYHLHFTVTDGDGQQTTVECHINVVEDDGEEEEEEHEHKHEHE